jgi:tetratricopeptide (TPR) repeat protein
LKRAQDSKTDSSCAAIFGFVPQNFGFRLIQVMSPRVEQLRQYLREEPNDPFLHYSLALEYARHQPAEASRLLDDVLEKFPDYLPAYYQAGLLKIRIGEAQPAQAVLRRGLQLALAQQDMKTAAELRHLLEELEDGEC